MYVSIYCRNEETAEPVLFYSKLPSLIGRTVVLIDPMLATGGSAVCAVNVLVEKGADIHNIFFFNVVSCPEGLQNMQKTFPDLNIITGAVDEKLDEKVSERVHEAILLFSKSST